jgi:hypothetical protein
MQRLKINHLTVYQFAGVVTFQPHRLLLRPREGHNVRIEALAKLDISPAHQHQVVSRRVRQRGGRGQFSRKARNG